ncbi:hypothetical protein [Epilithonimonas zeae]|uniref:hypothetical protein n=1 Tax=Epilithonimonas zeae TaxID=1416779 RepID=UPI00200EDCB8|nr:hypothetical protein [Epilithonimonas zeae]UQB69057.1 hypothetical protein KI430_01015 [Epilithonimonas zeae]
MKINIKYLLFVFFINLYSAQIETEIQTIQEPETYIQIKVTNSTDKKVLIYDSFLYSDYNIYQSDDDKIIALENYSPSSHLDYGNYQSNFNKKLIEETQIEYNLSYENAVYFLQNKKTSIIVEPNTIKTIKLRVFNRASRPTGLIKNVSYHLSGKIVFTTDFFPRKFVDCLEKLGFYILNEIEIPKTKIDIDKFFITNKR